MKPAGAIIKPDAAVIFAECEMVVKVKEPQPAERAQLRRGQVLYTYLHLAPDPEQTNDLVKSGVTAIAYETVTGPGRSLPLLKPMSQVAGRMAIQAGANRAGKSAWRTRCCCSAALPGVAPGKVVVIGGGVVGFNAAQMAVGLGADVTILDRDPETLEKLDKPFRRPRAHDLFGQSRARRTDRRCRFGGRRRADPRRRRAKAGHARHAVDDASGAQCWSMSPSTRAAVSKPATPPPTQTPRMWWTAWSTIASPTCPAVSRAPARMR